MQDATLVGFNIGKKLLRDFKISGKILFCFALNIKTLKI